MKDAWLFFHGAVMISSQFLNDQEINAIFQIENVINNSKCLLNNIKYLNVWINAIFEIVSLLIDILKSYSTLTYVLPKANM